METYSSVYVSSEWRESAAEIANEIMSTGVKPADALHTACAILAHCNYMLTTDDRLLKYKSNKISVVNPTEFIMILGGTEDDE
ncbi:MAG: PIN domain-containing protein [Oscillospiraceae bacterium]